VSLLENFNFDFADCSMKESFFWFFLEWAFGKDVPLCDGMKKKTEWVGACS